MQSEGRWEFASVPGTGRRRSEADGGRLRSLRAAGEPPERERKWTFSTWIFLINRYAGLMDVIRYFFPFTTYEVCDLIAWYAACYLTVNVFTPTEVGLRPN